MTEPLVLDHRELVLDAVPETQDSDTDDPRLATFFTPDTHRRALDLDATVVRGGRGVGKTYWVKLLDDPELRRVAAEEYRLNALRAVRTVNGYGSESRDEYPSQRGLIRLLADGANPEDIWYAVLLAGLASDVLPVGPEWAPRVAWVREHPDALDAALRRADRSAREEGRTILVLFDALDRLHPARAQADRLIEGLLRVALDLRLQRRSIRAKIFIRADMFDNVPLTFPDASKLRANAAELTWQSTELFGLLFHRMGNTAGAAAGRFRAATPSWRSVESGGRYLPPDDLVGDTVRQREVFAWLAGPWMGVDRRKGNTYTWLPNHLMDGAEQVSPRSFLSAVSTAARITRMRHRTHDRALHYDAIRNGVQEASKTRVAEVEEDMPWVARAGYALGGLQVPMDEQVVLDRWRGTGVTEFLVGEQVGEDESTVVHTGPKSETLADLVGELIQIGVMTRRADSRIDLPDVYRIAFDVGRKGGVKRIAATRSG